MSTEYQTGSQCRTALEKLMSDSEGTGQRALNYLFGLEQKVAELEAVNALLQAVAEETLKLFDGHWFDGAVCAGNPVSQPWLDALDAYKEAQHGS